MYFLSPLPVLSGALAAPQDAIYHTAPNPTLLDSPLTTSTPPARSTKTLVVTLTHTVYPTDTHTPSTPNTPSCFAIPPVSTHGQPREHGGAASLYPGPGDSTVARAANHTGVFAEYKSGANLSEMPMFTLATAAEASTSSACVGHGTLASHSSCSRPSSRIEVSGATSSPTAGVAVSSFFPTISAPGLIRASLAYALPTPAASPEPERTVGIRPIPSESEGAMGILPIPTAGAEEMMDILPIHSGRPMSAFKWPSTHDGTGANNAGEQEGSDVEGNDEGVDSEIAWAGTDNAIPAQLHDRSLPWLSPPALLQSPSASVGRVKGRDGVTLEKSQGKRGMKDCRPCEEEGRVLCRGDVAIGMCRGGCEEMQFFGRGRENGCGDD